VLPCCSVALYATPQHRNIATPQHRNMATPQHFTIPKKSNYSAAC